MTTEVSFSKIGGGDVKGVLTEPSGTGKAPGLVVIQEYWGLNAHVRALVDRFAAEGFVAVAPDLYHGVVTKDASEAGRLMGELDTFTAVDEIGGAAEFLEKHARCAGKVGVVGFCLGGALAFASGCRLDMLSAVASFYGIPPAEKADYAKLQAPVIAHTGTKDTWVTVPRLEEIKKQVDAHGGSMEIHTYDAGHAFVNDTRPEAYEPASAKLAWDRTIAFFKKNLA